MHFSKVTDGVYQVSDNLPNDRLFEGIWPTPNGVSVNAFLVEGEEEYALIDGISTWEKVLRELALHKDGVDWDGVIRSICEERGDLEKLKSLFTEFKVNNKKIGYVIINHMEPDHSGWLELMIKENPGIQIYISKRGADMLTAFFNYKENINVVTDGDTLDIGGGHVLSFYEIPNVHWPDTMVTFDAKSQVAFTCDAFGSYGAVDDKNYDDLLDEEKLKFYEDEAVGYYSNIVASFTQPVNKALEKLATLPVKIIAPGHGIVWRKNPERVVELYRKLASCQANPNCEEITVIWGSMYGMTERAVNEAIEVLKESGVKYHVHRVPGAEVGDILKTCWTSSGIILAMPTYEYNMFPPMASVLDELGKKKVFNRAAFRFGSFGWSGGAEKELNEIVEKRKMNWDFVPSVEFRGLPTEEDRKAVIAGVKELIGKVKELAK